jgi:hypothetical protein
MVFIVIHHVYFPKHWRSSYKAKCLFFLQEGTASWGTGNNSGSFLAISPWHPLILVKVTSYYTVTLFARWIRTTSPPHSPYHSYTWVCHVCSCYHNRSSSSSRFIYFTCTKVHYIYKTPVSPTGIFSISAVTSHCFGGTSTLYAYRENWKTKVGWTLLFAPICNSRCGAWTTVKYIHLVLQQGFRCHRQPANIVTVSLALSFWLVTADGTCDVINHKSLEDLCRSIRAKIGGAWAVIPMAKA